MADAAVRQLGNQTVELAQASLTAPGSASRPPPGVPEWVGISELREYTPGAADYCKKRGRNRARQIRRETGGRGARMNQVAGRPIWEVCWDQLWFAGKTVAELLAPRVTEPAPADKPPGWDEADLKDQDRHLTAEWARRRWVTFRADPSLGSDDRRHRCWVAECGERLKTVSIGTSLRSARRLAAWNPSKAMYTDGRRQRGDDPAETSWSEQFKGELLYVALKVYRGAQGTFKATYCVAAGRALKRGEQPPSYGWALAWYNRQVPKSHRLIFHDKRAWQRAHVESVRRDYSQYRPMQLWSGDWHRCDFRVFYRGRWIRPWLCVWQDLASRMIVGLALAPRPDTDGLLAAFARGVMVYGAPLGVLIDNGRDFRSKAFAGERRRLSVAEEQRVRGVCDNLGVGVHFCWSFNPGSKPPESWLRTFCLRVARVFPSYCGSSPQARPPNLDADLKAGRIEQITIEDAEAQIREWIDRVYHREPHSGDSMDGRTPLEAFADNPLPKRTAPAHILERMLLKPVRVKVTRRGVRYGDGGAYYNCYDKDRQSLLPPQGEYVLLRVPWDPNADASEIEVCTLEGKRICTAYNARLDGSKQGDVKELRRRIRGAKRQVRQATELMKVVSRPLDVQAMMDAQARYVQEQTKGRVAVGAESLRDRPLALLPGAREVVDLETGEVTPNLPSCSSGVGRKDSAAPLDALPMLGDGGQLLMVNPLDEAPTPESAADEGAGNVLDSVTPSSDGPDRVLENLVDALPDAGASSEGLWSDPLDD